MPLVAKPPDSQQPWLDIHPDGGGDNALEQLAGAAVRYRIAVGPIAGRKTMTLHNPGAVSGESAQAKVLTAARDGFSLNAAVACEAHQRDKLERLCRYVSRGPIALERLSIGPGLADNGYGVRRLGNTPHQHDDAGDQGGLIQACLIPPDN